MVRQVSHHEDQDEGREEVTSRVYMRHVRAAKFCSGGARNWWKRHGLDWSDFLDNGIAEETLLQTGDALALRVIEIARNENGGQG